MHTPVLVNINLHTRFEAPSFTCSKDMMKLPKFKQVSAITDKHDHNRAHLAGDMSSF